MGVIDTPWGWAAPDENGDIFVWGEDGGARVLARTGHMFLEHVAYCPKSRLLLAATGRSVSTVDAAGEVKKLPHTLPSTVAGLAVSPIGARVAASHYNGATILATDRPDNPPRTLAWKGSHLGLTYSPDGKWLVSAMQENAIHLWRLGDGMDLQMRGYPGKITQFSWGSDKVTLATNGGFGVPLWDFSGPKGPAGQQAKVIAEGGGPDTRVSAVAMHPKGMFCAVGYSDGLALIVNIADDKAVLLHAPDAARGAITHMAWHGSGVYLAVGRADGLVTVTDFSKLAR